MSSTMNVIDESIYTAIHQVVVCTLQHHLTPFRPRVKSICKLIKEMRERWPIWSPGKRLWVDNLVAVQRQWLRLLRPWGPGDTMARYTTARLWAYQWQTVSLAAQLVVVRCERITIAYRTGLVGGSRQLWKPNSDRSSGTVDMNN